MIVYILRTQKLLAATVDTLYLMQTKDYLFYICLRNFLNTLYLPSLVAVVTAMSCLTVVFSVSKTINNAFIT